MNTSLQYALFQTINYKLGGTMTQRFLLASSAMIASVAAPAFAQAAPDSQPVQQSSPTAAASETTPDNGDIIVTATRRSQSLSDVPIAISAVTAQTLQNTGAT